MKLDNVYGNGNGDGNGKGKGKEIGVGKNSSLTLLPPSVAHVVSLAARSSSLYIRLSAFVGRLALYGARSSTLTGLELSRAVMENILIRAGKDVTDRTNGGLGEAEAEGLLAKSLDQLHSSITKISFAVSTGFYFSSTIMNSVYSISLLLLATLDSIFGSTDSSRAIAGIITLIRREFQNPATGREGEKVGVKDLLLGISGLALLQSWCNKMTDAEDDSTDAVWDIVVLNNGKTADILDYSKLALIGSESTIFVSDPNQGEIMCSVERHGKNIESLCDELPEIALGKKMIKELPPSAYVSINTQTKTTKLITLVTTGAKPPNVSLPPGVELVEEGSYQLRHIENDNNDDNLTNKQSSPLLSPSYRMIYHAQKDTCNKFESSGMLGHEFPSKDEINAEPKLLSSGLTFSSTLAKGHGKYSDFPRANLAGARERGLLQEYVMDNLANQKRLRKPANSSSSFSVGQVVSKRCTVKSSTKVAKSDQIPPFKTVNNKEWSHNNLLNGSTSARTSLISKYREPTVSQNWPWRSVIHSSPCLSSLHDTAPLLSKDTSHLVQLKNSNLFASQGLARPDVPGSASRLEYYYLKPRQRNSAVIPQPEKETIHSTGSSPASSVNLFSQLTTQSLLFPKPEKKITSNTSGSPRPTNYRRSKSYVSSMYTLNSNSPSGSMIFTRPCSAFSNLDEFSRTGFVDSMFPKYHLLRNITRYIRFASASYGSNFLRVMGITAGVTGREVDGTHHFEHHSFSTHTQLPPSTILLSSFVDSDGGTDSTGNTNTGVTMVHFVSLDHDSKAVVLTCRGTLGFEDVLTDMTCDYDEMIYRGKAYEVHKGIHASARRLLDGGGGRVMSAISDALEKFPDYGLVMCGHSLGAAVSTLLAVMISEPNSTSTAFFTASLPPFMADCPSKLPIQLPKGRPVHVYAYGPPATMSTSLRVATRGLVTTIINDQDLVPYLSLGLLHDLQAVALAFKTDDTGAKSEVTKRLWQGITSKFSETWYNRQRVMSEEDDQWAYSTLKTLRACMLSTKLVPPGEVFVIETMPVLQRDGHIKGPLGGSATRVIFRYVKDVERRFREIQFGGNMLLDHSPGRYEANLGALSKGILMR